MKRPFGLINIYEAFLRPNIHTTYVSSVALCVYDVLVYGFEFTGAAPCGRTRGGEGIHPAPTPTAPIPYIYCMHIYQATFWPDILYTKCRSVCTPCPYMVEGFTGAAPCGRTRGGEGIRPTPSATCSSFGLRVSGLGAGVGDLKRVWRRLR